MSYYMGDYYKGDYYMGDPGFFSFLGRLGKGIVSSVLGIGGGGGGAMKVAPQTAMTLGGRAGMAMQKVGPIVTKVLKSRGGRLAVAGAGTAGALGAGYALGRRGRAVGVAAGGHRRRMNVCNPRALRRAIRRTHGFAKLAMKTIHLVHPKKRATFGGFRKKRAKR